MPGSSANRVMAVVFFILSCSDSKEPLTTRDNNIGKAEAAVALENCVASLQGS